MAQPEAGFQPGFQISLSDALVLAAGISATAAMAGSGSWFALIPGFVVGNFFFFCNVFRIARQSELLWTFCFLAAAGAAVMDWISWPPVFAGGMLLSVVLFLVEFRKPSYHGIWWKRINPDLPEWWSRQQR